MCVCMYLGLKKYLKLTKTLKFIKENHLISKQYQSIIFSLKKI